MLYLFELIQNFGPFLFKLFILFDLFIPVSVIKFILFFIQNLAAFIVLVELPEEDIMIDKSFFFELI